MERTPDALPDSAGAAPPGGELIVQNGRLSGSRRPLAMPLTLIGQAATCDVRLSMDEVPALQCALVWGPEGLLLRDLGGVGTVVNGCPVQSATLQDGDVLVVGPCHFCVRLPAPEAGPAAGQFLLQEREALEREKEALRIQAAAVVAQQAALTEEEAKLEQRRTALQRQEEQLSGHLEERRGRLLELQQRLREERATLQKERGEHEQRTEQDLRDLEELRREVLGGQQQVETERRRLIGLRGRLKKRFNQQVGAERRAVQRRQEELARQQRQLEQEAERLEQERTALAQARLRWNGEMELGRRQLQAGRDELHQQQRRLHEEQGRARAELRQLERRELAMAEAEHDLAEHWQHWEDTRHSLEKEVEGLENRVRNYRRKLADQEQELLRLGTAAAGGTPQSNGPPAPAEADVPPTASVGPVYSAADGSLLAELERLAGELADQRRQLAEQCERLVLAQERWREDHQGVLAEMESAGLRLLEREQAVVLREEALAAGAAALRPRHEEAVQERNRIEGGLLRLAAREAAWQGERGRLLSRLQTREKAVQRQWAALVGLRRRWTQRRRQEQKQLRAERERCQGIRHQYASLWEECFRRRTELDHKERDLAEQALALEQYRLECLGQAVDSAAAERQLERLRRRWTALGAGAERNLAPARQELVAESARLREQARLLQRQLAEASKRADQLAERRVVWENEQVLAANGAARLRQELQSLQAQRDLYEWQLAQVHDEVERVARMLIDGPEAPVLAVVQAA